MKRKEWNAKKYTKETVQVGGFKDKGWEARKWIEMVWTCAKKVGWFYWGKDAGVAEQNDMRKVSKNYWDDIRRKFETALGAKIWFEATRVS